SSVQCIVPFQCFTYVGEYAVCTRRATPDEVTDGKGADLMAKHAPLVKEETDDIFNCVGESIKTKFANKVAERGYCCGHAIHGNDDNCIVPFRCELYRGEYAVCTRHATPDEVKDGKGADLMAERAPQVQNDIGNVFNCVGESIKTKFANKGSERAYCCREGSMGMTIMYVDRQLTTGFSIIDFTSQPSHIKVFHLSTNTLKDAQCKNLY
ncbi:hypothetical protein PSTT_13563, partial [Puccinia striiformis]